MPFTGTNSVFFAPVLVSMAFPLSSSPPIVTSKVSPSCIFFNSEAVIDAGIGSSSFNAIDSGITTT